MIGPVLMWASSSRLASKDDKSPRLRGLIHMMKGERGRSGTLEGRDKTHVYTHSCMHSNATLTHTGSTQRWSLKRRADNFIT